MLVKEISSEELTAAGMPETKHLPQCAECREEARDWDDLIKCENCKARVCGVCARPRSCFAFCLQCHNTEHMLLRSQIIADMAALMRRIVEGMIGEQVEARLRSIADTVADLEIK